MKNLKIVGLMALLVVAATTLVKTHADNTSSNLTLDILSGANTYNVSGSIYLNARTASFNPYSKDLVNATFQANSFVVQDLKGTEAYNMSIKSDALTAGSFTIPAANVFIKGSAVTVSTGDVTCGMTGNLNGTWQAIDSDVIWMAKSANSKVCKAGVTPTIGVDIPAAQAVGAYAATLTITSGQPTYDSGLVY